MKEVIDKRKNLVQSVNPLLLNGAQQDAIGDLMPSGIHGVVESDEQITFNANITKEEVTDILENSPIDNPRFEKDQFTQYFGQDEISWCGLFSNDGNCLSLAAI